MEYRRLGKSGLEEIYICIIRPKYIQSIQMVLMVISTPFGRSIYTIDKINNR